MKLGLENISVFGMPPVSYVELAAELGCPNISLVFSENTFNPFGYPPYSLKENPALRRELKAALAANGVSVSMCENLSVQPGVDRREQWLESLEVFAELGAPVANSVSFDPDLRRNIDQYGFLAELGAGFGIGIAIEFVPIFGISDLSTARKIVDEVAHPNLCLTIDTMHVGRSGATADDLRAIPSNLVGHIQLCDVPLQPLVAGADSYRDEAVFERKVPGEGDLPLADYLAALPLDCVVGLEVPLRSEAEQGIPTHDSLRRAVAATHGILAAIA